MFPFSFKQFFGYFQVYSFKTTIDIRMVHSLIFYPPVTSPMENGKERATSIESFFKSIYLARIRCVFLCVV